MLHRAAVLYSVLKAVRSALQEKADVVHEKIRKEQNQAIAHSALPSGLSAAEDSAAAAPPPPAPTPSATDIAAARSSKLTVADPRAAAFCCEGCGAQPVR